MRCQCSKLFSQTYLDIKLIFQLTFGMKNLVNTFEYKQAKLKPKIKRVFCFRPSKRQDLVKGTYSKLVNNGMPPLEPLSSENLKNILLVAVLGQIDKNNFEALID